MKAQAVLHRLLKVPVEPLSILKEKEEDQGRQVTGEQMGAPSNSIMTNEASSCICETHQKAFKEVEQVLAQAPVFLTYPLCPGPCLLLPKSSFLTVVLLSWLFLLPRMPSSLGSWHRRSYSLRLCSSVAPLCTQDDHTILSEISACVICLPGQPFYQTMLPKQEVPSRKRRKKVRNLGRT